MLGLAADKLALVAQLASQFEPELLGTHFISQRELARFLLAKRWNLRQAAKAVRKRIRYCDDKGFTPHLDLKNPPPKTAELLPLVREDLKVGQDPCAGVDKDGLPLYFEKTGLVFSQPFSDRCTPDEFCAVRMHGMRIVGERLDKHDKVGATMVADFSDISKSCHRNFKNILAGTQMSEILFPEYMSRIFFINMPSSFHAIFRVVRPFLPKDLKQKFVLIKENPRETLAEFIDDQYLSAIFDGHDRPLITPPTPEQPEQEKLKPHRNQTAGTMESLAEDEASVAEILSLFTHSDSWRSSANVEIRSAVKICLDSKSNRFRLHLGERVVQAWRVTQVNAAGKEQERLLIATTQALYRFVFFWHSTKAPKCRERLPWHQVASCVQEVHNGLDGFRLTTSQPPSPFSALPFFGNRLIDKRTRFFFMASVHPSILASTEAQDRWSAVGETVRLLRMLAQNTRHTLSFITP